MLRDGKFIKEAPVRIGAHYVRFSVHVPTQSELFIQHLLLRKPQPPLKLGREVIALAGCCYAALSVLINHIKDWKRGN